MLRPSHDTPSEKHVITPPPPHPPTPTPLLILNPLSHSFLSGGIGSPPTMGSYRPMLPPSLLPLIPPSHTPPTHTHPPPCNPFLSGGIGSPPTMGSYRPSDLVLPLSMLGDSGAGWWCPSMPSFDGRSQGGDDSSVGSHSLYEGFGQTLNPVPAEHGMRTNKVTRPLPYPTIITNHSLYFFLSYLYFTRTSILSILPLYPTISPTPFPLLLPP